MSVKNIGELYEVFNMKKRGQSTLPEDKIRVCVVSDGKNRKALAISVGTALMKSLRWVTGDRVTIDFDPTESTITLRRVLHNSTTVCWMLSQIYSGKTRHGVVAAATVKISATPMLLQAFGMDDATEAYFPSPITTSEKGATFPLRKTWTVVYR